MWKDAERQDDELIFGDVSSVYGAQACTHGQISDAGGLSPCDDSLWLWKLIIFCVARKAVTCGETGQSATYP